jgi:hypothetical protein
VQVDQPVQASAGATTTAGNVQTMQGTVRQIDQQNGLFTLDVSNAGASRCRCRTRPARRPHEVPELALGDVVRIAGVFLNNSRVELRQFY